MHGAAAIARRAIERRVLAGGFPLEVEIASGRFNTVTVGQVLDSRSRYHAMRTRDPLEPGYDGGRAKGKLFLLDARPTLFSFAHGGRSFRLVRAPHRIEVVKGRLAEATDAALARLRDDPAVFEFGGEVAWCLTAASSSWTSRRSPTTSPASPSSGR